MDKVPDVVLHSFKGVGEGGHRGPVQTGHDATVDVLLVAAVLKSRGIGEVSGRDRKAPVVLERIRLFPIAAAALAVAFDAPGLDVKPPAQGKRRSRINDEWQENI